MIKKKSSHISKDDSTAKQIRGRSQPTSVGYRSKKLPPLSKNFGKVDWSVVLNKQLNITLTDISTTADMLTDRKTTSTKTSTCNQFFKSSDRQQDFSGGATPIVNLFNSTIKSPENSDIIDEFIASKCYEPVKYDIDIIDHEIMSRIETLELDLMLATKSSQSLDGFKKNLDCCIEFNSSIQNLFGKSGSKLSRAMRRLIDTLINLAHKISNAYEEQIKSECYGKERLELKIKQLEETLKNERKEVEEKERIREEESRKIKREIDDLFTVDKEYDYIKDRNLKLMDCDNQNQIVERLKDIYLGLQKEIQIPSRNYEDPMDFDDLELELRDKMLFMQKHTAYRMAYSMKSKYKYQEVGVQSDNPYVENGVSIRDLYDTLKVNYTTIIVNNKKLQDDLTGVKEKAAFYETAATKAKIDAEQATTAVRSFKDKISKIIFKKSSLETEVKTLNEKAERSKLQVQNLVKLAAECGISKEALAAIASQTSLNSASRKASENPIKLEGSITTEDSKQTASVDQTAKPKQKYDDSNSSAAKSNISFSRYGSSASEYDANTDKDQAKAAERQRQREKRKKELFDDLKIKSIDEADKNNEKYSARTNERSPQSYTQPPSQTSVQNLTSPQNQAQNLTSPQNQTKRQIQSPSRRTDQNPNPSTRRTDQNPNPSTRRDSGQSPMNTNRSPRRNDTTKGNMPGPLVGYPSYDSSYSEELNPDTRNEYLPGSPRVSVKTRGSNQTSIVSQVASAAQPYRDLRNIIGQTEENAYEYNSDGEPMLSYRNNQEGYYPSFTTRESLGPNGEPIKIADRAEGTGSELNWLNVLENSIGLQYNWETQEEEIISAAQTYSFSFNPNQVFGLHGDQYYKTRMMVFNANPTVPLSYKYTYKTNPQVRTKSTSPVKTTSVRKEPKSERSSIRVKARIPEVRE